jgi:nanoRNase/pAp phosphatase (c-di-AMP/oligoRNAs hydrolase)
MAAGDASNETPTTRVSGFSEAIDGVEGDFLVVGHNFPDPDCMAASLGVCALVKRAFGRRSDFTFGGGLGRAENRAMAGILQIEYLEPAKVDPSRYGGAILVDTQPGSANNEAPPDLPVVGVFDHHEPPEAPYEAAWRDVRTDYGSASTILTEYLEAAGVQIDAQLATALLVGVRTDTEDLERDESEADVRAFLRLYGLADRMLMQQIMRPVLDEAYFDMLRRALLSARRYGEVVVTVLDQIPAPDRLSEISELFDRLKGVTASLAAGVYEGSIYLSLRTRAPRKGLRELLAEAVGDRGQVGGHGCAGGGRAEVAEGEDPLATAEAIGLAFVEGQGMTEAGPRPVCIAESAREGAPSQGE